MNKSEKPVQRARIIWWGLGMAGVLFTIIPYILLGEDAIYIYADQLDGLLVVLLFLPGNYCAALFAMALGSGAARPAVLSGIFSAGQEITAKDITF